MFFQAWLNEKIFFFWQSTEAWHSTPYFIIYQNTYTICTECLLIWWMWSSSHNNGDFSRWPNTSGGIIMDALNAFNRLNRSVMLHNFSVLGPSLAKLQRIYTKDKSLPSFFLYSSSLVEESFLQRKVLHKEIQFQYDTLWYHHLAINECSSIVR